MTTRALIIAALLLTFATAAFAQHNDAAYAEIGGSGIIPTANYERRFTPNFAAHIGLGIVTVSTDSGDDGSAVTVPVVASYLSHPASNHHLEAGGGVLFITGEKTGIDAIDDDSFSDFGVTGLLGYRYQKPGRGFVFRASYTPILSDGEFTHFAGLSFGYAWDW
jgi:hypothetical protein